MREAGGAAHPSRVAHRRGNRLPHLARLTAMRAIRLTVAVLVGAGMMVFAGAGTAFACSCVVSTTADQVGYADVIVTGTLADIDAPDDGTVISSVDPVKYTVDVERTFKGDPQRSLVFSSARFGASCGLEGMQADRRYTFFLYHGDNGGKDNGTALFANLCGGTRPASDDFEARVAAVTGPPVEAAASPSAGSGEARAEASIDRADESSVPTWAYAAVGGGVVVIVAGFLVWRRVSSQAADG
jgi:hypothetical protein